MHLPESEEYYNSAIFKIVRRDTIKSKKIDI